MKHLIHKTHHPHLKKRAMLEILGLIGLVAFIILQRDILQESFITVLEVDVIWFVILLSCYWIMLPLTALSYRFISPKPERLRLKTTILAHLAGAGPGRIIPGGIGNLSVGAMHLKKTGLTIEQAIGVVVTNNIFGLISNGLLLVGVLVIRPEIWELISSNVSSQQLLVAGGVLAALIILLQWLMHARGVRQEINKASRQFKKVFFRFIRQPRKVACVALIALTISLVHAFMLDFSAFALGINLSIADALVAMSFGVVIGGVLPTPGGVGGAEAGITAALLVFGLSAPEAASVAVLFRLATYWQPFIPGTLAYLYLRERRLL
jgi:uncharacterized protein (TIRG00374 family)